MAVRPGSGPDLPYSIVAGVTPSVRGWLVASAKLRGTNFALEDPRIIASFADVLDERPSFSVVALNARVGWADEAEVGERTCDREARAMLGRRAASVDSALTRIGTEDGDDDGDDRLEPISTSLLPRYREVAAEMAPYRQRTVYEVQPELSFYQLNGDLPLRWSKGSDEGRGERLALLESRIPDVGRILDVELDAVVPAELLEVAACLWTARRIAGRAATRLPADPEWDVQGLRMEILR
jgi:predicted RNase H-like nuclease